MVKYKRNNRKNHNRTNVQKAIDEYETTDLSQLDICKKYGISKGCFEYHYYKPTRTINPEPEINRNYRQQKKDFHDVGRDTGHNIAHAYGHDIGNDVNHDIGHDIGRGRDTANEAVHNSSKKIKIRHERDIFDSKTGKPKIIA
jgi:hypothetical protein